jgi:hypothetical protein
VLSFALPVAAGPLEDSRAAYEHGDFATAMRLFRSLAEHGNAMGLSVRHWDLSAVEQL